MHNNDTIIAQVTPPGYGGVGILRISGQRAEIVAEKVLGKIPIPRYATYLPFKDEDETILDRGIALWFPGPNSFTGEDVLELQAHCSPVILDLLCKRILSLSGGIRIAQPGEFSERAFLNKKIDLVQAEAISDLIHATSEQEARSASQSLFGTFSDRINFLLEILTRLRINTEAAINFPEETIVSLSERDIKTQIDKLISALDDVRTEARRGSFLREGFKVVIAGPPNVGKSSLLNTLTGRDAAIITDIPGTTRDVLHEHIHFDGIPFHIIDTAGLRDAYDKIERIGIERALKAIKNSNRILFMIDTPIKNPVDVRNIFLKFGNHIPNNVPITIICNKIDLTKKKACLKYINGYLLIYLSVRTGEGIDILRNHLKESMGADINSASILLARRRHLDALEKAAHYLLKSKARLINRWDEVLFLEDLRLAHHALGEITGLFTSEDLLKGIFSTFCVGK